MGVVWAEFLTTSIYFLPIYIKVKLTVKTEGATLPQGPGETAFIMSRYYIDYILSNYWHSNLELIKTVTTYLQIINFLSAETFP